MRKFKDINILGRKVTLFRGVAVNGVEYWRYSIGEFDSCLHISMSTGCQEEGREHKIKIILKFN